MEELPTYNEKLFYIKSLTRMVYVLDIEGKPLMPTVRNGKVRRLLREGKAHVVKVQPFTIQLDYESEKYTQPISLGIDAGSVHIGVSATTEKKELLSAEVVLRTDIVKKIATRREQRKTRRYRKTRYRKNRDKYRKRKAVLSGQRKTRRYRKKQVKYCKRRKISLAPSIRYIVDKHSQIIHSVHTILPITKTIIEVGKFDIQKAKNPDIQGVEYQQGEQKQYSNVRDFVLARDHYTCQHCQGKSKDKVLEVHHIESRKTGGNAPNNLITLCQTCHMALHRGEFTLKKNRGKSYKNEAAMNAIRWIVYIQAKQTFSNVYFTAGYKTKKTRVENKIEKAHYADAFCISGNIHATRMDCYMKCRCLQRHTRALHIAKPSKGGKRRSTVASHWIGNTRLQRYDTVIWNGIRCFISGSSNGRLYLKDINWKRVTPNPHVNANIVKFKMRNRKIIIQSLLKNNL